MVDPRLATKQYRLNEWAKVFQDRAESGMKIDDFSTSRGISTEY